MESKRNEKCNLREREINIWELLWEIAYGWRFVLVCAVVFAVLGGGFGYWKTLETRKIQAVQENITYESLLESLTVEEKQAVEQALYFEQKIQELEVYQNNSLLMKIDPYEKNVVTLVYSIDTSSINQDVLSEEQNITEKLEATYMAYINNEGYLRDIADEIELNENTELEYIGELVNSYDKSYGISDSDSTTNYILNRDGIIYIFVTGEDASQANEIADEVSKALTGYHTYLEEKIVKHDLILVDRYQSCGYDEYLANMQLEIYTTLDNMQEMKKNIMKDFSDAQLQIYSGEMNNYGSQVENSAVSILKYVFLGLILGIIFACMWVVFQFIFGRHIHSSEEIESIYNIRLLGIWGSEKKKGKFSSIDCWLDKIKGKHITTEEENWNHLVTNIKLLCKKQNLTKVFLVTSLCLNEQEQKTLEAVRKVLEKQGIQVCLVKDILCNMDTYEQLVEMGKVILVEKVNQTTYNMLENEIHVLSQQGVEILGAIVF